MPCYVLSSLSPQPTTQEEALIEADNKAHMKAWQAQLADMKARQAAAVAAAKAAGPPPAPERSRPGAGGGGGIPRPSSMSHLADVDGTGTGAGSSRGNSKKRSYAAVAAQDDEEWDGQEGEGQFYGGSSFKVPGTGGAGTHRSGGGGGRRSGFEEAAAAAGDEGPWGRAGEDGLAGMGSGGLPRKKKRPGVSVARLIGLAAQAAAAEGPPPRFCVVQLMPEQQQQQREEPATTAASSSAAAAAAGRPDGRSRKQPKAAAGSKGKGPGAAARQLLQHLSPGQVAAPSIDRPFLACPVACTVAELKKMLLQQLSQQGTTAQLKSSFEVQLVQGQQRGLLGGSSSGSEAGSSVLADALTVGQLRDKGGCLGPDVLVQYRLVGV